MLDLPQFEAAGFAVIPGVLDSAHGAALRDVCASLDESEGRPRAGLRALIDRHPTLGALAASSALRSLVDPILGPSAFVTRSILFDKTPGANWDVVWHQDITIAVQERINAPGFGPWSVKAGVPHVQPPAAVLEHMVTVRIHLDDCLEDNGPLLVVPGSHRRGILPESAIDPAACDLRRVSCNVPACGVMLMRPLILHASRKAAAPLHRRVIHFEFARDPLPGGLSWARI